jgi:hypothetical protein
MTVRGRPPFWPFSRAAAALASVVALPPIFPPRRPSATACGFLRGIGDAFHAVEGRRFGCFGSGDVLVAAVLQRERRTAGDRPEALHRVGDGGRAVHEVAAGLEVLLHGNH